MDRGDVRGPGRGRHLPVGLPAPVLQPADPRFLRFRPHAARHPDLLGDRGHVLSRRSHHRRSGVGIGQPALEAGDRRVRHPGAAVRGHGADLHPVRQGAGDLRGQRPDLRSPPADLAVLCRGVDRRRVGGGPDRHPHLPTDLPSRGPARREPGPKRRGAMSADSVAIVGFVVLFALMLLRVPVGMAMGLVGVSGYAYLSGGAPALKLVGQTSMRTVTDYQFGVIPMFLLMGAFVSNSGVSRELFRAANTFVGHRRGGLGLATIVSCGAFAAISGSSVATAATFSTVAYPEMRRYGYPQSFSTGVIAAGGTLGAMLPPSTVLAVYGIITEQDIGKLFIAGIVPGLLAAVMYVATIAIIGLTRPGFLPEGPRASADERLAAVQDIWAPLLLFVFVIGGLYGLPFLPRFTPTEAGGVGAAGAFLLGVLRGRLRRDE